MEKGMKEEPPQLVEGCPAIGAILGVTGENARLLHRRGLIPVVQIGSTHFGNRDALLECRRQGRYWTHAKRRERAEARFALQAATEEAAAKEFA
jgi:hypothetical protein